MHVYCKLSDDIYFWSPLVDRLLVFFSLMVIKLTKSCFLFSVGRVNCLPKRCLPFWQLVSFQCIFFHSQRSSVVEVFFLVPQAGTWPNITIPLPLVTFTVFFGCESVNSWGFQDKIFSSPILLLQFLLFIFFYAFFPSQTVF